MKIGTTPIVSVKSGTTPIQKVYSGVNLIWSSVDPDAQAFITAAAITNPTQQSAIEQLVTDLKGYGIWYKMKALYPFVGGTASSHKWNLKDPRDLDAAYRLVFSGGVTHSSNGVAFNGVNGWANTFLALNTLTRDSNSSGVYIRTNVVEDKTDYGIYDSGIQGSLHFASRFVGDLMGGRNGSNQADVTANSDSRGLFQVTRRNSIGYVISKNTTKTSITRTATDLFSNTATIPIGCLNFGTPILFSSKQFAFFYVGNTSLNDIELDNFYTAVQTFQVTLGRSIGTQTVSDADAQAFVTNAGIVDQVEADAVNNLVIGLKADGLWSKMKALYPFVGGTASSHKFNLKDPRDLDAAFRLVFNGGWIHNLNGITGNGINTAANTFMIINSVFSNTNGSFGFYMRNDKNSNSYDFGNNQFGVALYSSSTCYYMWRHGFTFATSSTSKGFYSINRTSTNTEGYKNNINILNVAGTPSLVNDILTIGAQTPIGSLSSPSNYSFNYVSDTLNATEVTNLYTRVQAFQTALNRQV